MLYGEAFRVIRPGPHLETLYAQQTRVSLDPQWLASGGVVSGSIAVTHTPFVVQLTNLLYDWWLKSYIYALSS